MNRGRCPVCHEVVMVSPGSNAILVHLLDGRPCPGTGRKPVAP